MSDDVPKILPFHITDLGGVIAHRDVLEAICKQKINPAYFQCEPIGAMILVVEEEVPQQYGRIQLADDPESPHRSDGKMGVGYVLAAGPEAGKRSNVINVGPIVDTPDQLLYLHVIMGSTTGMPIRLSILDTEFRSKVFVMPARDLKAIDHNPGTMKERAEAAGDDDSRIIVDGGGQ